MLTDYGLIKPYEQFKERTTLAMLIPMKAKEAAA
jgi:hypothetical protein